MYRMFAALILAAATLAIFSSEASAWACTAASSNGSTGWGSHPSNLASARRRALAECAVRTPRRYTCYITACR